MITTALKWLLDRLPINLFPPQFRPVLMIIQRLGPYLGYIGTFIAWSWAGIKGLDKGAYFGFGCLDIRARIESGLE